MGSFELKGAVTVDIGNLSNLADAMWLNSGGFFQIERCCYRFGDDVDKHCNESVWTHSRCTSSGDRYLFVLEHAGVASRICWCISRLSFASKIKCIMLLCSDLCC
jgi:hypothetical protein